MLKYAREDNKSKISELVNEIDIKRNIQIENNKKIDRIRECLNCCKNINESRFTVVLSGIIALIGLIGLINGISIILTLFFFVGGSSLAIKNFTDIRKLKTYVRSNYSDLLEIDSEKLFELVLDLHSKNSEIDNDFESLHAKISYYENELDIINRLENDMKMLKDPYYIADSKEQYEILTKTNEDNFNEFLTEGINYSGVHFDSSIDNKKLIKNRR